MLFNYLNVSCDASAAFFAVSKNELKRINVIITDILISRVMIFFFFLPSYLVTAGEIRSMMSLKGSLCKQRQSCNLYSTRTKIKSSSRGNKSCPFLVQYICSNPIKLSKTWQRTIAPIIQEQSHRHKWSE